MAIITQILEDLGIIVLNDFKSGFSFTANASNIVSLAENTVYRNTTNNFHLEVSPDTNHTFGAIAYFNHINYNAADSIARICFKQPKYIIHGANKGKKNMFLDSKEIQWLKRALRTTINRGDGRYNTVWVELIIMFDTILLKKPVSEIITYNPVEVQKDYPEFMPLSLKMPNYDLLKYKYIA